MHQALPNPPARVLLSLLTDAPPSQHRPAHRHQPRLTDYAAMLLLLHQPLSALTPTPRRLNDAPQALLSPPARVVLSLLTDPPPSQHRPAHRHHPRLTDIAVVLRLLHQPNKPLGAPGTAEAPCSVIAVATDQPHPSCTSPCHITTHSGLKPWKRPTPTAPPL